MLGRSDARVSGLCTLSQGAHAACGGTVRWRHCVCCLAVAPSFRFDMTGGDDEMRCGQGRCPAIPLVCSDSYLARGFVGLIMVNVGLMQRACIACIKVLTASNMLPYSTLVAL
jgi:hypothetical protein